MNEDVTQPLTVAQMADVTGVSAHTLRYYERAGLIHAVGRSAGNQRRYSSEDVEWLKFLLRLRATGMPIAQMRRYAELRALGADTMAERMSLLESHRVGLRQQVDRLHRHEDALMAKIDKYRTDLAAWEPGREHSEGAQTVE